MAKAAAKASSDLSFFGSSTGFSAGLAKAAAKASSASSFFGSSTGFSSFIAVSLFLNKDDKNPLVEFFSFFSLFAFKTDEAFSTAIFSSFELLSSSLFGCALPSCISFVWLFKDTSDFSAFSSIFLLVFSTGFSAVFVSVLSSFGSSLVSGITSSAGISCQDSSSVIGLPFSSTYSHSASSASDSGFPFSSTYSHSTSEVSVIGLPYSSTYSHSASSTKLSAGSDVAEIGFMFKFSSNAYSVYCGCVFDVSGFFSAFCSFTCSLTSGTAAFGKVLSSAERDTGLIFRLVRERTFCACNRGSLGATVGFFGLISGARGVMV